MKKCPFCKADIEDNARFCLYCMKPLNEKEVILPPQKKKKWWLLALAVALLLVLLVAFLLIRRGQPNLPPAGETSSVMQTTESTNETTQQPQSEDDPLTENAGAEDTEQVSGNQTQMQNPNSVTSTPTIATKPTTSAPTTQPETTQSTTQATISVPTTETEAPTKSTKPTKTPKPTTPPETTQSTKPTKPTATTRPGTTQNTKPTKPTATTRPEATQSTKPTKPTATTQPETTQSTKPTKPTATTQPETSQSTSAPTEPEETTTAPTTPQLKVSYTYRAAQAGDDFNANYSNSGSDIIITGVKTPATNGVYDIPSYIDGKKVIAIARIAFANSNAKIVYVPATVKTIWDYAFTGCNLTDIYFRGNAIYMEGNALSGNPVIHCSASCSDRNFHYYKYCAADYGATWKEWNG